jgi:hypothetical protein
LTEKTQDSERVRKRRVRPPGVKVRVITHMAPRRAIHRASHSPLGMARSFVEKINRRYPQLSQSVKKKVLEVIRMGIPLTPGRPRKDVIDVAVKKAAAGCTFPEIFSELCIRSSEEKRQIRSAVRQRKVRAWEEKWLVYARQTRKSPIGKLVLEAIRHVRLKPDAAVKPIVDAVIARH